MNAQPPRNSQPNPSVDPPMPPQPPPAASPQAPTAAQPMAWWRLGLPLLLQSLLIVAVPAQDAFTYTVGRTVVLQTAPVDPYDMLRGYYQVLGYQVSNTDTLATLPGGEILENRDLTGPIYVVLEEPATATTPPTAWVPVGVSQTRPTHLPDTQIALRGRAENWRVLYGLETYYMPEDQRDSINQAISQLQNQQPQSFVVEVKIDGQGHAVPVSLWVGETNYRF
ncbi:putative membrane-anchored protein [Leptolyngbya sp. BL0902]|uniref:GDYXXLXY domain-containing protein n=1 Tax=Leptolyngbya sp. BL0902 TaxID=1115757 RepID=UPI0019354657|nr:GDYXXLXY domain-containing protein [Leptolyngbya sp. BL0902]QQE65996.1 putative membrane-anchored protein [Leptolyngbya sp. BL0902]